MSPESVPPILLPPFPEAGGQQDAAAVPAEAAPSRGRGSLGVVVLVLVCALAFLLASTPARNSDLWLHLASGRALVGGEASIGTDPFASTTGGARWVDHSWLGDVLFYAANRLGGGLVVAKAVVVALLAGLLFLFRRRGGRLELTALGAGLAVVALGPWLAPQPLLFSLPALALTLYLLERPNLIEGEQAVRARRLRWLLLPLFALWANLDGWFLLGPALVGLYAVGSLVSRNDKSTGAAKQLVALTAAGAAACLLTPYHYHTFAWPTPLGLSHTEQVLMGDPLGQGLVVAPFAGRWSGAVAFASPGGWAYCLLLAGGLVSFALTRRSPHLGRMLAWFALAALSIYQARTIPLFAVVAGPVLALNLQDWAAAGGAERRRGVVALALEAVAGVALLVLAWPGWLQPTPHQPRGWTVEPDRALAGVAGRLERWHTTGRLRSDRFALTFSPEVANYLAWFAPSEKGFLDSRWPLFDPVADDFLRMRRCLLQPEGDAPAAELGPLLEAHHIDRVILHDPNWERTTQAYRCLLRGKDWELLALEGGTAVFGWRGAAGSPPAWEPFDWGRAAYHPDPTRRAPAEPRRPPEPAGLFGAFTRKPAADPSDREEAGLDLIAFDFRAEQGRPRLGKQWLAAQAVGLLAAGPGAEAAGTAGTVGVRLLLTPRPVAPAPEEGPPLADQFFGAFLAANDQGPPEPLLLAVRSARRALAANPDDARAFLLLGEAYLRLATLTREPSWGPALSALPLIRRAQILTALEQAALLQPDLDECHALLAQLYSESGQLDRALDHLRDRLRVAEHEAEGHNTGAAAAERRSALRAEIDKVDGLVRHWEGVYAANVASISDPSQVLDRARLAARYGLTKKALGLLLESHPAIFGKAGTKLELDLMLQAGRAYEVRDWLAPEYEEQLGAAEYHSLRLQADAACGDYAGADAELAAMGEPLRRVGLNRDQRAAVREAMALQAGGAVLARPGPGSGAAGLAGAVFLEHEWLRRLDTPVGMLRGEGDLLVLRGLLALESGDAPGARDHFAAAAGRWDGGRPGAGIDFLARPIAEEELRRLDAAGN
jgi:tetratricopeptide (TPR) repeat protein